MTVRTSGPGPTGLSLLIVPLKNYPGVTMRRLKVAGPATSGTTFIELDDVRVPVENLIGTEGMGMKYVMTNFNHERLYISMGFTRQARAALAAAFEYVMKREAFGKALIEQPVVRHRLAKAGALLETQWAWVEQFVYQMTKLKKEEADVELGGLTGLCKAQAGMVLDECARCAVLLFGGNGLTRTGQGEIAERRSSNKVRYDDTTLTVGRHLSRSARRPDSRWIRRRVVGPGGTAAGQELQEQDETTRTATRIIQAVAFRPLRSLSQDEPTPHLSRFSGI